jgi:iron complex outermembrane receptor protein
MVKATIVLALMGWLAGTTVSSLFAQKDCHASLIGSVTNAETAEPIAYAEVLIVQTGVGVITDEKGKFALTEICEGQITVLCRHIGYSHQTLDIQLAGEMHLDFSLRHEALSLSEIVVQEKAIVLPSTHTERRLEGRALDAAKGQTLGDLLKSLPGVTSLNTGSSISKPVIRGMHSNRVLLLNNGVRQEGQQWGSEHAPEVDPYIAGKVSVVYGANSVRYGPDALGGVILIEPKPLREKPGWGGEANLAGFSNGKTVVASAYLDGKKAENFPLVGRLQGTIKRGGNLRTPEYFLDNTGVREINYSAALGLDRKNWQSEVFFSQFFTHLGIFKGSHIGNLTDLQNAIERGRPLARGAFSYQLNRPLQQVAHYLLKVKTCLKTGDHGKASVQYGRQFNRRQEFDAHRNFNQLPNDFSEPDMMFEITTHSLDASWEHKSWRHFTGSVGGQLLLQKNTTDRGGLIPDYNSQTGGFFWIERWRKYPLPFELETGIRYDFRRMGIGQRGNQLIDKKLNFNNLSGSVGAVWHAAEILRLRFHAGSGWRAPSVNELFSDGVHHGSASYEIGREDLSAERAFSFNLSFDFDNHRNLSASLAFYRNYVQDFIFLEPQENPVLTIRGAFPSFAYNQADARLTGFDWNGEWKPAPSWTIGSVISVLRAWNRTTEDWLVWMPADRFSHSLKFSPVGWKKTWNADQAPYLKATVLHVARQKRAPENEDFAPPPAAYILFDVEAGTTFLLGKQSLDFGIAVQNLFNTAYRDYLNRLRYFSEEAGRNVSARLKLTF